MAAWTPERCSSSPLHHSPQSSAHPEGAQSWCTEWWCLWCIYDRSRLASSTLPFRGLCISCCSGSRSFSFFFVCHVTRNTPGIRTYMEMHGMHTSCSAAWFTLLMLTISHFSLCLSISSPSHPILSQSLSINKSFLAGCSRLNQPVCKHGY